MEMTDTPVKRWLNRITVSFKSAMKEIGKELRENWGWGGVVTEHFSKELTFINLGAL